MCVQFILRYQPAIIQVIYNPEQICEIPAVNLEVIPLPSGSHQH